MPGSPDHRYALSLVWTDAGPGTVDYRSYSRGYRVDIDGKPPLLGSADPTFRGDASRHNPEDLLVAALSSCHMLSYLALCARRGVRVVGYRDDAEGTMRTTPDGGGRFTQVTLRPQVTLAPGADAELARSLHEEAHATCFIARSVAFPVDVEATIATAPRRQDLAVKLDDRPGALAAFGEALGRAGVSLEGGGGFVVDGAGVVHFLVADGPRAAAAAREAGLDVLGVRDVVEARLDQDRPGQLGSLARALGDAGVNVETVYSDHDGNLVLVVADEDAARRAIAAWRDRPATGR